ncbi:MAG: outer membrane protein assembly factor BamA [Hylemonella sp.]|nr:outer membrane protein assembly factor BamA [Hylemonella sp.]MDP1938485.1 outer membrane protein assembly factor BamA [Hylemonella sp.]
MQIKRFFLRTSTALAALFYVMHAAWAVEPFKVRDIRVEGLQRIEPGTVFASMPIRVGDTYSDEQGAAAIRALFGLGLFKDIRLEVSGDVLVVIVEERPTVADVEFIGTKEFDKETLKKAMRDVGLTDGRPFDKALLDRAEQELKRQYINRSLYAAEVVTTVTPIERNRVNLTFTVNEGDPVKISEIRIVGNKAFSESTLRDQFDLDTGNWMSWYTKSDRYSRTKLNADIETLRSYYLTRGYLEFRVDSTQVAISPNKQEISITINVSEGERFVVSGVKLEGNYLGREDEFKALVSIRPGQAYNADQVAETTKAFTDYFGKFGFAFARVQSRPDIDRSNNQVLLVLQADPSRRVYVRRINVAGNNRTRDEVVRRELRQFEASWYDGEKIKLSRNRVDRLGYFTEVNIESSEVAGSADQVDLTLKVAEKPTGSLTLGAGFSSNDGLGLSFGINQQNVFGSGNSLGLQLNTSRINRLLVLNSTNPYFTKDGVSRTIDVYHRVLRPYYDETSYSLETTGTSLRFGVPVTERDTVYLGAGVERTTIVPGSYLPVAYSNYANEFGYASNGVPLTAGWARDNRDSALVPTSGNFQRATAEWSVGGEVRYIRGTYQYQHYVPLSKKYTFAFNGDLGWGQATEGKTYPIFKNYYGGGLGSVRGFEAGSLGPRDATSGLVLGGPKKVNLNFEFQAPFPGVGNDRTLRMYGFVDTGNVFGADESITFDQFRSSVGVGISWISPMGPLRLAFATPLRKFDNDRIQNIQFQIGTSF